MSKTKAKLARREAKRDSRHKAVKAAARQRKAAKASQQQSTPKAKPGAKNTAVAKAQKEGNETQSQQQQRRSKVPFGEYDNILLVGEGDFSFTHSIVTSHGCASVVSTSYDSASEVLSKYPQSSALLSALTSLTPPVPIHHGIDATKLHTYKALRAEAPYKFVVFNFPHTGGLSTDVNRQVRANQALVVGFFKSILASFEASSKSSKLAVAGIPEHTNEPTQPHTLPALSRPNKPAKSQPPPLLAPNGKILVTLFDGEPYTLWNIRDLARHVGLRVVESWRFDWEMWPGYKHVRTLGKIDGDGGWKGEDREARTFVFDVPGEGGTGSRTGGSADGKGQRRIGVENGKRKRRDRDSDGDSLSEGED